MFYSVIAIACGATLGALLRWVASTRLNPLYFSVPLGTLTVNVVGGYLIGLAIAFFTHRHDLPQAWRLFVITGFLGALTTFSTFSVEVVEMLQDNHLGNALAIVGLHVTGSLVMTWLGMQTMQWALR